MVVTDVDVVFSSIDFGKILHTIFDLDQPFTIKNPANLNNIFLSIRISPSRYKVQNLVGQKPYKI